MFFYLVCNFKNSKVQLARVLVQEPKLLLLDEPTSHLDIHAQVHLMKTLQTIASQGIGVLVIIHDLNLASLFCQELVLIANGTCLLKGKPSDVLTETSLQQIYGDAVTSYHHPETGQLMIVPSSRPSLTCDK